MELSIGSLLAVKDFPFAILTARKTQDHMRSAENEECLMPPAIISVLPSVTMSFAKVENFL